MEFPGFVGETYQSRSPIADAEQCVNLYPEQIESGAGKNRTALYGTPGLSRLGYNPPSGTYQTLPGAILAMRTLWSGNSGQYSTYCITCSTQAYANVQRTLSLCLLSNFGVYSTATLPASYVPPRACFVISSGTQILILLKVDTGSLLYCYNVNSPSATLTPVTSWDNTQNVTGLDFLDGFFLITTTKSLYASAAGDGTSWNALNYINISDEPDGITGLLCDHRLVWIFGKARTEAYYNAGGVDFAFQRVPQGVMETGCVCAATIVPMGDSIFWLGSDRRGGLTVWRNNGYTPVRVSNHAIEQLLASTVSPNYSYDRVNPNGGVSTFGGSQAAWMGISAYAYREGGHLFYVLNLGGNNPDGASMFGGATTTTAPTTLVYDATTGLWHERRSWDGTLNSRHLGNFYAYDPASGGHVVSDYRNAQLYLLSNSIYTDNGTAITRWRTTPHLSNENKLSFYSQFTLDADLLGNAVNLTLSWSNDGGRNWNNGMTLALAANASVARAIWRRLGKARDRVFKVQTSDAFPIAWINAYLELTAGNS